MAKNQNKPSGGVNPPDGNQEKKIKVRALQSFAGIAFSCKKGEVIETIEELASDWIKHGLAEEIK